MQGIWQSKVLKCRKLESRMPWSRKVEENQRKNRTAQGMHCRTSKLESTILYPYAMLCVYMLIVEHETSVRLNAMDERFN